MLLFYKLPTWVERGGSRLHANHSEAQLGDASLFFPPLFSTSIPSQRMEYWEAHSITQASFCSGLTQSLLETNHPGRQVQRAVWGLWALGPASEVTPETVCARALVTNACFPHLILLWWRQELLREQKIYFKGSCFHWKRYQNYLKKMCSLEILSFF